MPLGDRLPFRRHPGHRMIRSGERFDSGELDRGEIELELPPPSPEPADEPAEPWAWLKVMTEDARKRLAAYRDAFPEVPDGAE